MKQHVTAVGVLHIGYGVLGLLIGLTVLVLTVGPGLIVLSAEGEALPLNILLIVGCGVAGLLALFSVPGIIGGVGLLRRKVWARYLVLILAVVGLFNIPIGTAVGGYTLWVLLKEEVEEMFASGSSE